ncbi:MAG: hypothetical protein FWB79_03270 [Treponema sp.]|nr:hypothetical protein [Treponema sp.]
MTIQSVPYQTFSGMDHAISESLGSVQASPSSYGSQPRHVPASVSVEGVDVDTMRVIDLLLGQLEQLSYQLARMEAQTEPAATEANVGAEISAGIASMEADYQARFDAFVEMYAQVRADVESAGLIDDPYVPASQFAGMLFEIAA